MTIDQYTTSILPLIKLGRTLKRGGSDIEKHTKYLYNHSLYGYEQFGKKYASRRAQEKYQSLGFNDPITNWAGRDQKKFDRRGKRDGHFHLDHVYTLKMMRSAISLLSDRDLTVHNINQIVRRNYCVAWILKSENAILERNHRRSNRGTTLADALDVYHQLGINLLHLPQAG